MVDSQKIDHPSNEIDWWSMLTDPEYLKNPYPELKKIQQIAPVHHDSASDVYFVLGHHEFGLMAKAPEMGRDTRLWTNGWSTPKNKLHDPESYQLFSEFQPQMTNSNPPDHRRMRVVYAKAFQAGAMARYLPMIEAECRRLLDDLPVDTPVDFMTTFANLLPHRVSLNLFGIPQEMYEKITRWSAALSLIGSIIMTPDQKRDAQTALREFKAYLRDHLASLSEEPGDGFMDLARTAFENGTMDEEETLNNLVTLISGSAATPTLLGNGMLTLLKHPAQFEKLRANQDLMKSAIEEMLRFEPDGNFILRVAINDFQCGEVLIPSGSLAIGLVGAINRDPGCFEDPDVFDISRHPNPHYVFGGGPHICIGKELVYMTADVAFTQFMDRFSQIELAGEPDWWTDRSDQHGLHKLPLRLSAV